MVAGTEAHAEGLKVEVAAVLAPMGLRLSEEKTTIVHIDEGFDFLGWRIQRQRKRGSNKAFVYTWPSKKALASIMAKVKAITRQGTNKPLSDLLRQLNSALRGWTNYFRHGVSKATFSYLSHFTWHRVLRWLRRKHPRPSGVAATALTETGGGQPGRRGAVRSRGGAGHPLPLPGGENPYAMGRVDDDRAV